METHHDGGRFTPAQFDVDIEMDGISFSFSVNGFKCEICNEKVMSRDTLVELEQRVADFKMRYFGNVVSTDVLRVSPSTDTATVSAHIYTTTLPLLNMS